MSAHSESRFACVRIVNLLIHADGSLLEGERRWLAHLIEANHLDETDQEQLRTDLLDPPSVTDLFRSVTLEYDRRNLLGWLNHAMQIDGVIDRAEWAIYREFKALIGDRQPTRAVTSLWADVASGLLASEERKQLWIGLEWTPLNQKPPWWRRGWF